jgi:hypothetical protein
MLMAMITQVDLATHDPNVLNRVHATIKTLSGSLTHNESNNFVESACWADDIKKFGFEATSDWHFINIPYHQDNTYDSHKQERVGDVIWALDQAYHTLTDRKRESAELETGLMLRYLIHLVSDIHQPLHVTTLYSKKFTHSDYGGNFFHIQFDKKVENLHDLWDSVLGTMERDYSRPISDDNLSILMKDAKDLIDRFPREDMKEELRVTEFKEWAQESFKVAVDTVYEGIELNKHPTDRYLENGIQAAHRLMALAGYRLADLLRQIYK